MSTSTDSVEALTGAMAVLTGFGVLLLALFPLALPILLLTIVFTAPLVLLALPVAVAAVLALPVVVGVRALRRRKARRGAPAVATRRPHPVARQAHW